MFWKLPPRLGLPSQEPDVNTLVLDSPADVMRAAQTMVNDAGEGEFVKDRLRTAARRLGIEYGLAKRIRNNEIKQPPTHIFLRMAQRYAVVLKQLEEQSSENTARYRERLREWGLNESAAANGASDPPTDR